MQQTTSHSVSNDPGSVIRQIENYISNFKRENAEHKVSIWFEKVAVFANSLFSMTSYKLFASLRIYVPDLLDSTINGTCSITFENNTSWQDIANGLKDKFIQERIMYLLGSCKLHYDVFRGNNQQSIEQYMDRLNRCFDILPIVYELLFDDDPDQAQILKVLLHIFTTSYFEYWHNAILPKDDNPQAYGLLRCFFHFMKIDVYEETSGMAVINPDNYAWIAIVQHDNGGYTLVFDQNHYLCKRAELAFQLQQ